MADGQSHTGTMLERCHRAWQGPGVIKASGERPHPNPLPLGEGTFPENEKALTEREPLIDTAAKPCQHRHGITLIHGQEGNGFKPAKSRHSAVCAGVILAAAAIVQMALAQEPPPEEGDEARAADHCGPMWEDSYDCHPPPTPTPPPTHCHPLHCIYPTSTPKPTSTPRPTSTPMPTPTPQPTSTPMPTPTPQPTNTPRPTSTPRPTNTPRPTSTPLRRHGPLARPRLTLRRSPRSLAAPGMQPRLFPPTYPSMSSS